MWDFHMCFSVQSHFSWIHNAGGRNPAPPGMYKTLSAISISAVLVFSRVSYSEVGESVQENVLQAFSPTLSFLNSQKLPATPPKFNIPKMVRIKAGDTFSKAHHLGALQPLVFFFPGCREWQVLKVFSWNLGKKSVKQVLKPSKKLKMEEILHQLVGIIYNLSILFCLVSFDGKNPAPLDRVNFPLFTRFHTHVRWSFGISEPSTVCDLHFCGSKFGKFPHGCGGKLPAGMGSCGGYWKIAVDMKRYEKQLNGTWEYTPKGRGFDHLNQSIMTSGSIR